MEVKEYKSNSYKSKEDKKKVEKIISGTAMQKNKTFSQKIAGVFATEDVPDLKNYILWEVVVPSLKDVTRNGLISIVEVIFGSGKSSRLNKSYDRVSYRNYNSISTSRESKPSHSSHERMSFDNIRLDNKKDADIVMDQMEELIEAYGIVSIADLKDIVGLETYFTDNKYGWSNIRSAKIVRVSGGWLISMPNPYPID